MSPGGHQGGPYCTRVGPNEKGKFGQRHSGEMKWGQTPREKTAIHSHGEGPGTDPPPGLRRTQPCPQDTALLCEPWTCGARESDTGSKQETHFFAFPCLEGFPESSAGSCIIALCKSQLQKDGAWGSRKRGEGPSCHFPDGF